MTETVVLDGETLTPEDVEAVAREHAPVEVADDARESVRASRERIEDIVETGETVYGVTTGFGELVDVQIPPEDIEQLQTNLVRSHVAGAGRELESEEVRAMMCTRVNALAKGFSGVREAILDHLVTMLNGGVRPVVNSRGSLGASGDLIPLAHMALVLIGEGQADVGDERLPGDEALATADLEPLTLQAKEGLALINGTQLTVGLASLLVRDAERAVRGADISGALTTEVTMGSTASCDAVISAVRPHEGQAESAGNVKLLTRNSEIVESHRNCDRVQDAYAIRCLPQVHGAVRDAVSHLREAVTVELNSATDNPLVYPREAVDDYATGTEEVAVLSGGNFHGEPLALRLDYVTGALTELAAICERRVDRMLNPNLQEDYLPAFLTEGSGLRSGYMLAQYTAAALLNENRAIGRPSTDNTPVSGNQEDHVSMSAQSAFEAQRAARNTITVVGIELLCGAQAAEFIDDQLAHGDGTGVAYETVREVVDPLSEDRPIHEDIERTEALIASGLLEENVQEALESTLE